MKNRKGFSLFELIFMITMIFTVVAASRTATPEAMLKTFEANHKTLVSAYAMHQAANNGEKPKTLSDLGYWIDGGIDAIQNSPEGAVYTFSDGVIISTYTDPSGTVYERRYPSGN